MKRGRARLNVTSISPILAHFAVASIIVALGFLFMPALFLGDVETARNYLNTIVACLSTILALCISIIMVAIQFTASKYTHRVLDFYIRLPYNASLLTFYLVAIVHSIYLMAKIRDPIHASLQKSLSQAMSADLFLVVCCFVSLMVYIYAVVQLIKPGTILRSIEREYRIAYRRQDHAGALGKVEQICDLAKKAVLEMDSITGVSCVKSLTKMICTAQQPVRGDELALQYHKTLLRELVGIAVIAGREREHGTSVEILDSLKEIGMTYLRGRASLAARLVVEAYAMIVADALIGQQQFSLIERIVTHLYAMGAETASLKHRFAKRRAFILHVFRTLNHIGRLILDREVGGSAYVARDLLSDAFGALLSSIVEEGTGNYGKRLVNVLLFEYMKLAKLLMQTAEMRNILQITTWLRREMLPSATKPYVIELYVQLYMLLASTALYLHRIDIVIVMIRALGKALKPDRGVVQRILKSRKSIRYFYDYHEPTLYLVGVHNLWFAYHEYCQQTIASSMLVSDEGLGGHIAFDDRAIVRASTRLLAHEDWSALFDGRDAGEWLDIVAASNVTSPLGAGVPPHPGWA